MSSASPKNSSARKRDRDVWVVGSGWAADIVADALAARGGDPGQLTVRARFSSPLAVHLGNGECRENARRIFGEAIAGALWEVSAASYARAKVAGLTESRCAWLAATPRERDLLRLSGGTWHEGEPWLRQGKRTFLGAMTEPSLCLTPAEGNRGTVAAIHAIEPAGSLRYRVRHAGGAVEGSVVVVVSDALARDLLPWLHDKLLPVTLTSVNCPPRPLPFAAALFGLGADFAVSSPGRLRLGSYRNLYEDKAYGAHEQPDAATVGGVERFFGELGWYASGRADTAVESLGCDGLPLVGAMPDMPGVYVVAGFAARTQNFIFEVADRLAAGILEGSGFSGLDCFSTKRFT